MKAIHEARHQHVQWSRREFDTRARNGILVRLFRDLSSSSYDDRTSKDSCAQEAMSAAALKQRMEV